MHVRHTHLSQNRAGRRNRCVLAGLAFLALSGMTSADARLEAETLVRLPNGVLRGAHVVQAPVVRFLGIPYAEAPVGAARWLPPRPARPWDGERSAERFGPPCVQLGGFFGSDDVETFDKPYGSEDCLYLNVWVPTVPQAPRPVLVFIHGGGGVVGAASLPLYEATRLASELGAVVVSMNYRLGFFGALALPSVATAASSEVDLALQDQIEALRWVQANIAVFGGDPGNVTVMGHSAGAVSVWAMLRSKQAAGLFHKAIILSGFPMDASADAMQARGESLLTKLLQRDGRLAVNDDLDAYRRTHGDDGERGYLLSTPADEIIEAARGIHPLPADPNRGHDVVNPVPTVIGTVENEASLLLLDELGSNSHRQFWDLANSGRTDLNAGDFLGTWPFFAFRIGTWAANRWLEGWVDRSADRLVAKDVPVYRYVFAWDDMPSPWRELLGPYHGLDVPFVFGNFQDSSPNFSRFTWTRETVSAREELHRKMMRALRGFIEHADPNYEPGEIHWHRWNNNQRVTVIH